MREVAESNSNEAVICYLLANIKECMLDIRDLLSQNESAHLPQ